MSLGLIVSKDGSNIDSSDPSNIAIDTRTSGGMKVLRTYYFTYDDYTETYIAVGQFGATFTLGRIYIPHGLSFSPAFKGYLNSAGLSQPLPVALGEGVVIVSSDEKYVVVEGAPTASSAGGPYTLTITIFAESLESTVL